MVNSLVPRATSQLLIGPDWAMNIEICDTLNRDPGQAKDVIKGLKKRIRSKNPKVQLLALTLLETVVKNCGDIVHMHVAEKAVVHEMMKIVKKKPDNVVKEKILTLIDTWQEAFGGPRARYPQYYAAYQELLRAGVEFPHRSERATPIFTSQTQPLTSHPQNLRNPDNEIAESAESPEFPTLSLTEIQNARGIMDVLSEMLTALNPENKEGLRQEVIMDLVDQCRTYKQRVVHLVNTTSDEELLTQGLSVNDDLQRVLAKYETIASGTSAPEERPKPIGSLVDIDDPVSATKDNNNQADGRASSSATAATQHPVELLLPAPPAPSGITPVKTNPKMDLLSGDDFSSTTENSLALVPVDEPQTNGHVSEQNALVPYDMFSQTSTTTNSVDAQSGYPAAQMYPSTSQVQNQQLQPVQFPQPSFYTNGVASNNGYPPSEQSPFIHDSHLNDASRALNGPVAQVWNHQQQQQQHAYGGTAQSSGTLPPPPWEAQQMDNSQQGNMHYPMHNGTQSQPMENNQFAAMYNQQITNGQQLPMHNQPISSNQWQPMHNGSQSQPMENNQFPAMYNQQITNGQQSPVHNQPISSNQWVGLGPQGNMHYSQQMQNGTQPLRVENNQVAAMYTGTMPNGQLAYMSTQPIGSNQWVGLNSPQIQGGQMMAMSNGQMGYMPLQSMQNNQQMHMYGQRSESQFLEQRMHGLSMQNERAPSNSSYQMPMYGASSKPARAEDKLFGDLVNIAKIKPNMPTPGGFGGL